MLACVGGSDRYMQLANVNIYTLQKADFDSSIISILRLPPNQPPSARLTAIESNVDTTKHAWVHDLAPTAFALIRPV
jgi:hypothetical protein